MARPIPEEELAAIEHAVRRHPGGVTAQQIAAELPAGLPRRTLQYRLKIPRGTPGASPRKARGVGRPTVLRRWKIAASLFRASRKRRCRTEAVVPLSESGAAIRNYLRQPPEARKPVGYNRDFLDSYQTGVSAYLSAEERAHLVEVGRPQIAEQPAGTYAKQILNRFLIDLSWNSSRLEGNTYSLRLWCMDLRISISGSASVFESLSCLSSSTHRVATISPEPSTGS